MTNVDSRLFVCSFLALTFGSNVFLHNPRGSNNRLDESGVAVRNANRLFNSQNNALGGYGVNLGTPSMYYYESSVLFVEWTALDARDCAAGRIDCTTILQYMCGSSQMIRDGVSGETINENNYAESAKFGMHESLDYFKRCEARNRNGGLFIADRLLNGESAQFTRQSNGGTRYGFECAEERDYYPYWHPSPWTDVAVITNHVERCEYYKQTALGARGHCESGVNDTSSSAWQHNNKKSCEDAKFQWRESARSSSINCIAGDFSSSDSNVQRYDWTLPNRTDLAESCTNDDDCVCILRIRFNVSSSDYQAFGDRNGFGEFVDYRSNRNLSVIAQDARVSFGGGGTRGSLQLSTNTHQMARTFQDRSHAFRVKRRKTASEMSKTILNLNVRGKRGNAVQVFPSLEYAFVPSTLRARQSSLVHVQWVGFDANPSNGNNNGNGRSGTDRSNICQIQSADVNRCICPTDSCFQQANVEPLFKTMEDRLRFAFVGQSDADCDSYETLAQRHANDVSAIEDDPRNCMLLNAAEPYFDGGLISLDRVGTFHYVSTRNNNFSNRLQKGTIVVVAANDPLPPPTNNLPCLQQTTCPSCTSSASTRQQTSLLLVIGVACHYWNMLR